MNPDGSFQYLPAQNALVHAHLGGARAQLVVQNYDPSAGQGGDFSPAFASAALATPSSRSAFASSVAAVVRRDGWDGVVIDFEQIAVGDQPGLVDLLSQLRSALPTGARLTVAVPVAQADNPASLGYDLRALAAVVDVVQLMTYDQNDPTSSPGPMYFRISRPGLRSRAGSPPRRPNARFSRPRPTSRSRRAATARRSLPPSAPWSLPRWPPSLASIRTSPSARSPRRSMAWSRASPSSAAKP